MLLLPALFPQQPHTEKLHTEKKKACPQYINLATQFNKEGLSLTVSRQLCVLLGQDPEFPFAPTEDCRSWQSLAEFARGCPLSDITGQPLGLGEHSTSRYEVVPSQD